MKSTRGILTTRPLINHFSTSCSRGNVRIDSARTNMMKIPWCCGLVEVHGVVLWWPWLLRTGRFCSRRARLRWSLTLTRGIKRPICCIWKALGEWASPKAKWTKRAILMSSEIITSPSWSSLNDSNTWGITTSISLGRGTLEYMAPSSPTKSSQITNKKARKIAR